MTYDRPGVQAGSSPDFRVPVVEPGALLINLGDLTARWTNEVWRSTLRRDKPPVVDGRIERRRSAGYFHDGNVDAVISTLPGMVTNSFTALPLPDPAPGSRPRVARSGQPAFAACLHVQAHIRRLKLIRSAAGLWCRDRALFDCLPFEPGVDRAGGEMDLGPVLSPVKDIGTFIRDQRTSAQISLRGLAAKAGVSNPYLSQVERGLRRPSADILAQIAHGLSISVESILARAGILEVADAPEVVLAIRADPILTERQKASLVDIYSAFRKEAERVASTAAPRAPDEPEPGPSPSTSST